VILSIDMSKNLDPPILTPF